LQKQRTGEVGKDKRKGCKRVNMLEILCTYVFKKSREMRPVETVPGRGGGEG
jgi:hypothetical protein